MSGRPDRSQYPVHKTTLREGSTSPDVPRPTPEECIGMMWELAMNAWAFMGHEHVEPRLQRHVLRVGRRQR